ncbi:Uncharacterised protein [Chlamydia trachomatis]|nr:Uncharacterised protein [Chlamydia trachomatis]
MLKQPFSTKYFAINCLPAKLGMSPFPKAFLRPSLTSVHPGSSVISFKELVQLLVLLKIMKTLQLLGLSYIDVRRYNVLHHTSVGDSFNLGGP